MALGPKYDNLGLVIDATNMAAGATVYSNWFDGVEWVRNILCHSQSDQQPYDVQTTRRNEGGTTEAYISIASSQATTGLKCTTFGSTSAILGYSARFAIKNNAAAPNTYAKLWVQLMGI